MAKAFLIVLQVLGITEDNIFKRIELKIGKDKADKVSSRLGHHESLCPKRRGRALGVGPKSTR